MSILTFFKPTRKLPTAKNTGLSEHVTHEANKVVESAQWLTALYDSFRGRPDLILNGFKEAGIIAALENQTDADTDEDPFADLD